MKKNIGLFLTFLSLIWVTTSFAETLPSGIALSIEVEQSIFDAPQDVQVTFLLSNVTNLDITFKTLGTIADVGLASDVVRVINGNGAVLSYSHPHIKRIADLMDKTLTIRAGETYRKSVYLSGYYSISESGVYSVSLKDDQQPSAKEDRISISVLNSLTNINQKQTFAYRSCSAAQVNELNLTLDNAQILARIAYSDLKNTPISGRSTAPRYREWFGNYSASNYLKAEQNFAEIDNVLTNRQVSLDCSCRDFSSVDADFIYAYVFPTDPFVINLCPPFFTESQTGTDSKPGIIIHEMSHFEVVAGTGDEVYGTTASRNLARSNPSAALNNADNYEYFAENNPTLRMSSSDMSSCTVTETGRTSSVVQPGGATVNSLSQAVDDTSRVYLSGDNAFFRQSSVTNFGGDAAQSGNIENNQSSGLSTRVYGPGSITFDWRVSSEANFDFLFFAIVDLDGNFVGRDPEDTAISGSVGWRTETHTFPAGAHDLYWIYSKDFIFSDGSDAGWVDRVRISESSQQFRSSNRSVTDVICTTNNTPPLAPIINLILGEND